MFDLLEPALQATCLQNCYQSAIPGRGSPNLLGSMPPDPLDANEGVNGLNINRTESREVHGTAVKKDRN